jgi:putative transposase
VVSKAVVIAYGVHETGRREILGLDVGEAETEAFGREFLGVADRPRPERRAARRLRRPRGAQGGDRPAASLPWQRRCVHFVRDCLGHARKDQHGLLAALIRPIFKAESGEQARQRLGEAIAALEQRLPKVAAMLTGAEETSSPSTRSRRRTGRSCARRTRSSASTRRSAGAPTSSASSPTTAR